MALTRHKTIKVPEAACCEPLMERVIETIADNSDVIRNKRATITPLVSLVGTERVELS
jgi:hypothetical protein